MATKLTMDPEGERAAYDELTDFKNRRNGTLIMAALPLEGGRNAVSLGADLII